MNCELIDNNIVYINLTEKKVSYQRISKEDRKKYIGGTGINTKILFESEAMYNDALSEKNVLIFGAGAAVGTGLLTGNRSTITAKSPLTDLYGDSNIGGDFPTTMRSVGIDHLIFEGKSETPVYIYIDKNGQVKFEDASDLWGIYTDKTTDILLERHNNCEISCIGPAGENLIRYASVFMSKTHVAGRMGMGCVMGSKKLKAIVIERKKCEVPIHDREKIIAISKLWIEQSKTSLQFKLMGLSGTLMLMDKYGEAKCLPVENAQRGYDERCKNLSPIVFKKEFETKKVPCKFCTLGCGKAYEIKKGKYKGEKGERIEYGSATSFGPNVGIYDYSEVLHLKLVCDKLGMDTIEVAATIALILECQKRGVLKEDITEGRKFQFGNADDIEYLMYKTSNRSGIGEILAEGSYRASNELKVEKYAFCIKKASTGLHSNQKKAWSLGYITSTRGGDHLKGFPFTSAFPNPLTDVLGTHIFKRKFKGTLSKENEQGRVVWWHENYKYVIDSLGMCLFCMQSITPQGHAFFDEFAEIMNALFDIGITKEDMFYAGERIYQLQNAFNINCGMKLEDYKWPLREKEEDIEDEFINDSTIEVRDSPGMLPEYFYYRGLSREGIPTTKRFIELKLGKYIERIKYDDSENTDSLEILLSNVSLDVKLKFMEKIISRIVYKIVTKKIDKQVALLNKNE